MTITLEPPEVIHRTSNSNFKHEKRWLLIVYRQGRLDDEQLKEILNEILPIGEGGAQKAVDEIKRNDKSMVYKGNKIIIEHYFEQLTARQVTANMRLEK